MKKPFSVLTVVLGTVGLLVLGLSSCAIQPVVTATGYILDSSNGYGISGATVKLDNTGTGTTYTVSPTGSDGSYSIPFVAPGQYNVTVSQSGYYFPPVTFTIQTGQKTIPNIPGVPINYTTASAGTISFILVWQNTSAPLDLQMTYPPSDLASNSDNTFTNPYYNVATNWSSGFGVEPSISAGNRPITNSTYTTGSNSNGIITMGAMDSSGGPVAIQMSQFPFPYRSTTSFTPSYLITASSTNGLGFFNLPSGTGFEWYGVGEVYISSSSSSYPVSSYDGTSGANPVVYVVQAGYNSGTPTGYLLGTFTVPNYTTIQATSIIRVDLFRDNNDPSYYDFLIVPDQQVVTGGAGSAGSNLRSVTSTPSVIAVRAKGK